MSFPTISLTFTPNNLRRTAMTVTTIADFAMSQQKINRTRRPMYKFTLTYDALSRSHMQELQGVHHVLCGGTPFYYPGGEFGGVENYVFIATADGHATPSYLLPNKNIGTGSYSVRMRNPASGVTSVTGDYFMRPWGQIDFTVTPTSGMEVYARWGCYYLVNFAPDGIKMEQIARNVWRCEFDLIESALVP